MNVREAPRAFSDMVLQALDTRVNRRVRLILLLTRGGVTLRFLLLPGRPPLLRQRVDETLELVDLVRLLPGEFLKIVHFLQ